MEEKLFRKNNEAFTCIYCCILVAPHPFSSRDHCTSCLHGLHVDIQPGDRLNTCHGVLIPIGLQIKSGKQRIVFSCNTCSKKVFNTTAPDDNEEALIALSTHVWQ